MKLKWYRFLSWFYYFIGKPSKGGYYTGKIAMQAFINGVNSVCGFMEGFKEE